MVEYELVITKKAAKEGKNLSSAGLKPKIDALFAILRKNPYEPYPTYEKLSGDMAGAYARRINIQHRLVYEVLEDEEIVRLLRMWTHYE